MAAVKNLMIDITRAIEAAENAINEAADRLRQVGDLVYGIDGEEPMVRLSYDEIDCLTKAKNWLEGEFETVKSAREC